MKKIFKIAGLVLLMLVLLQTALFFMGKFGWKLFGFSKCENPDGLITETVYVTDETAVIIGDVTNSAASYVGYAYKIKDDKMYVGVKQNMLLGFIERRGKFGFEIKEDLTDIESIYLTDGKHEKCIWKLESDKKYMEKIKALRLYSSININSETDIEAAINKADYTYADDDMLSRIRHPAFSGDLYVSKGSRYLGVAELDNGECMYLGIERHYDCYSIIGQRGHYDY